MLFVLRRFIFSTFSRSRLIYPPYLMSISSCSITSERHHSLSSNLALKSSSFKFGRATSLLVFVFSVAFFSPRCSRTAFTYARGRFLSNAALPSKIKRSFSFNKATLFSDAKPTAWPNLVSLISALS